MLRSFRNLVLTSVTFVLLSQPNPTFFMTIRHCSGCATDDPHFCSKNAPQTAAIALDVVLALNTSFSAVSLLPTTSPITLITQNGADLLLSGTLVNSQNNTISLGLITPTGSAIAEISFPDPETVYLALTDINTGRFIPCPGAKARRGSFVTLVCQYLSYGTLVISGSVF